MNDDDYEDLFSRPTDPDESRDAASSVRIGYDRQECFFRFCLMLENKDYVSTRKIFQFKYLIHCSLSPVRAQSIRRRISDLIERKNNPFPAVLWLLRRTGEKYDKSAILTLTERGILVRENPKIMTGLWGQAAHKKTKPTNNDEPRNTDNTN
jgi:hypothetical protein